MHSFSTSEAARDFVSTHVDRPASPGTTSLGNGTILRTFPQTLKVGSFTNVYDLAIPPESVRPSVELCDNLTSVFDFVSANPDISTATGGGFFFLADQASATPHQLGLNLAISNGKMRGFPVVDRETVLTDGKRLSVEHVQALGTLTFGHTELSWSGSLTQHETDVKIFANGNSKIRHVQNDMTGSMRVLDESSRFTPAIDSDDTVDIGFIHRSDGTFVGILSSNAGGLDIFAHDVVARTHERCVHHALPEMIVKTVGNRTINNTLQGAISVGPMLNTANFTDHPINKDESLGGKPPFLDVPLARTVLYATEEGVVHIRLFDGRPGSLTFPGVTPNQAAETIKSECRIAWGCFLDPGQTAKLVVRDRDNLTSYGNTHYLKWPKQPDEKFVWVPKTGRPVASMIALR